MGFTPTTSIESAMSGQAKLVDGKVVIAFSLLSEDHRVSYITVNVDAYAEILARDILTAAVERDPKFYDGD